MSTVVPFDDLRERFLGIRVLMERYQDARTQAKKREVTLDIFEEAFGPSSDMGTEGQEDGRLQEKLRELSQRVIEAAVQRDAIESKICEELNASDIDSALDNWAELSETFQYLTKSLEKATSRKVTLEILEASDTMAFEQELVEYNLAERLREGVPVAERQLQEAKARFKRLLGEA